MLIEIIYSIQKCNLYLSLCHAVLIVYDVSSQESFQKSINMWYNLIQKRNGTIDVFLIGNKCDLNKRQVQFDEKIALQKGIYHYEVSSLLNKNTELLLCEITNTIYSR